MFANDRDRFDSTEDKPVIVGYCTECHDQIEKGEPIWIDPTGDIYHKDCFEDYVFDILKYDFGFQESEADA